MIGLLLDDDRVRSGLRRRTALLKRVLLYIALALLSAQSALAAPPHRQERRIDTFVGPVLVESHGFGGPGSRPAVVVLGGSRGLSALAYDEMAQRLNEFGIEAFLAHVLSPADLQFLANAESALVRKRYQTAQMPRWIAAVQAVMKSLRKGRRVGLLGVSLGATIALASESDTPLADALILVDGGTQPASTGLAPLLLIWGRDDGVFPLSTAHAIKRAVESGGGSVKLDVYEGAAHDFFIRPGSPQAAKAHRAAAFFLKDVLSR